MASQYQEKCPIWGTPAEISDKSEIGQSSTVDSPRAGGRFAVDEEGLYRLRNKFVSSAAKVNLSRWISEQNTPGFELPFVDDKLIKEFGNIPVRNVVERLDDAMFWLGSKQTSIAEKLMIQNSSWVGGDQADPKGFPFLNFLAATSCINVDEGEKLLEFLQERKLINRQTATSQCTITPAGWAEIVRLKTDSVSGKQAFVAMWFGTEMDEAYKKGFDPAIRTAGYDPRRIDKVHHNNPVDDEIIAEIRRSAFVVADFTSQLIDRDDKLVALARGGVYFEAGFAKGLGKPVIWCARKDIVDADALHFDTRQFAHIVWKDVDDLRLQLAERIVATLGEGPLKKFN